MKKVGNVKKEKKGGKKLIFIAVGLLVLLGIILFWWFNRKFDFTIKFNNEIKNEVTKIKYLKTYDDSKLDKELIKEGYTFLGYFETYYLSGKEIESIKEDSDLEKVICKNGFELDFEKVKCVAIEEFDFKNTKIKKDTIIEALWGKSVINKPAKKTTTTKKKTTTTTTTKKVEESPKDTGKISLSVDKSCIIGYSDSVVVKAQITGETTDKNINWKLPKCYTAEKVSDNVYKLTRTGRGTMCRDIEELSVTVTASLRNGSSSSTKFSYEYPLEVTVYDGNTVASSNSEGNYEVGSAKINSNIAASFTTTKSNVIKFSTDKSVSLYSSVDANVTVKTPCGQSKTIHITALIN